ncbi:MAG TPA: hypothetical protein VIV11_29055 [Kofleriaceae bacterium]
MELQLHEGASVKQYRELGLFVRDCISRIERRADRADWWSVKIVPNQICFCADVIVQEGGVVVQATGNGFDGAVAAWDAFAKVESQLRDNRAHDDTVAVAVDATVESPLREDRAYEDTVAVAVDATVPHRDGD